MKTSGPPGWTTGVGGADGPLRIGASWMRQLVVVSPTGLVGGDDGDRVVTTGADRGRAGQGAGAVAVVGERDARREVAADASVGGGVPVVVNSTGRRALPTVKSAVGGPSTVGADLVDLDRPDVALRALGPGDAALVEAPGTQSATALPETASVRPVTVPAGSRPGPGWSTLACG